MKYAQVAKNVKRLVENSADVKAAEKMAQLYDPGTTNRSEKECHMMTG